MDEKMNGVQSATTQPEVNGKQAERTFTQEEVNKIVSERLSRERAKNETMLTDESNIKTREDAIAHRENTIECREYIYEKKLPQELLEILDTGDSKTFKEKIDKLAPLLRTTANPVTTGCATLNNGVSVDSRMRKAFDLN